MTHTRGSLTHARGWTHPHVFKPYILVILVQKKVIFGIIFGYFGVSLGVSRPKHARENILRNFFCLTDMNVSSSNHFGELLKFGY